MGKFDYPVTHTDRALEADIQALERAIRLVKKDTSYCPVKMTEPNWKIPSALRELAVTWLEGKRDKLRERRRERKVTLRRKKREVQKKARTKALSPDQIRALKKNRTHPKKRNR